MIILYNLYKFYFLSSFIKKTLNDGDYGPGGECGPGGEWNNCKNNIIGDMLGGD